MKESCIGMTICTEFIPNLNGSDRTQIFGVFKTETDKYLEFSRPKYLDTNNNINLFLTEL